MDEQIFGEIEQALAGDGLAGGFAVLTKKFLDEKNYPALFEARLMQKRLELGLPAVQSSQLRDLPDETRKAYEAAQIEAAQETGERFLADGNIYRAWPYFRALGNAAPIARALEQAAPSGDDVDGLVEIAFHEGVHPRRGFELILEHYGTCRAITNFTHYPSEEGKAACARLLVDDLYSDILAGIKRSIESVEGKAPETESLTAAIGDRDWLFEGRNYYVDTSHVASVVQMSVQWEEPETLRRVIELAEYGMRLDEMFQFKGDPPFENVYKDTAIYLKAVLGEEIDEAIAHFRGKISEEPDPYGNAPAQAFVNLLVRIGRPAEAIDAATKYLGEVDPQFLQCPTALELCQMAGDFKKMAELARAKGDLLGYAAAIAGEGAR